MLIHIWAFLSLLILVNIMYIYIYKPIDIDMFVCVMLDLSIYLSIYLSIDSYGISTSTPFTENNFLPRKVEAAVLPDLISFRASSSEGEHYFLK